VPLWTVGVRPTATAVHSTAAACAHTAGADFLENIHFSFETLVSLWFLYSY
jgi:hypothetical protein